MAIQDNLRSAFAPLASAQSAIEQDKKLSQSEKEFSSLTSRVSAVVYEKFSKAKQDFSFFLPCVLPNLLMLYQGSPEHLKKRFEQAFALTENMKQQNAVHLACMKWLRDLVGRDKAGQIQFSAPQGVAVRSDMKLNKDLESFFNIFYNGESISFNGPKEAEDKANAWISKATNNEITSLVKELDAEVVVLLLSAAIFKGDWTQPFDATETKNKFFTNADGKIAYMKRMLVNSPEGFKHGKLSPTVRYLEMPFKGDLSMLVFLPEGENGEEWMKNLNESVNEQNLKSLVANLDQNRAVLHQVAFPKLSLKQEEDLLVALRDWDLIKEIKAADFNGSLVVAPKRVGADKMLVQTNIDVSEEGAKVTAAMATSCALESYRGEPVLDFNVDHPFAIAFFDSKTKTVLGMAQVAHIDADEKKAKLGNPFGPFGGGLPDFENPYSDRPLSVALAEVERLEGISGFPRSSRRGAISEGYSRSAFEASPYEGNPLKPRRNIEIGRREIVPLAEGEGDYHSEAFREEVFPLSAKSEILERPLTAEDLLPVRHGPSEVPSSSRGAGSEVFITSGPSRADMYNAAVKREAVLSQSQSMEIGEDDDLESHV